MAKQTLQYLVLIILLSALIPASAHACGCGIAIADMKVFNALKETQAYLLINVTGEDSYTEMPFFRFVSMDRPYNVTIVFPIDQVPSDVSGEKITASEFLEKYGIDSAENHMEKQTARSLVKQFNAPLFLSSNGLIAGGLFGFFGALSPQKLTNIVAGSQSMDSFGPVAHFEFEGGSLDIYNVTSMETLDQFVKKLNITLTDKVQELVTKYKDYYVAVLYLGVPTIIDEKEISDVEACMPGPMQKVRDLLSSGGDFASSEMRDIEAESQQYKNCSTSTYQSFYRFIHTATQTPDNSINGTLLKMSFSGAKGFFYPTSVVNTYKYPIKDQKYFIATPDSLDISLSSSRIGATGHAGQTRWYKVGSIEQDLQGVITPAGTIVRLGDTLKDITYSLNSDTSWVPWFVLALLICVFALPLALLWKPEGLSRQYLGWMILGYFLGGLLITGIVWLVRKKYRLAAAYFVIWVLLLAICFI